MGTVSVGPSRLLHRWCRKQAYCLAVIDMIVHIPSCMTRYFRSSSLQVLFMILDVLDWCCFGVHGNSNALCNAARPALQYGTWSRLSVVSVLTTVWTELTKDATPTSSKAANKASFLLHDCRGDALLEDLNTVNYLLAKIWLKIFRPVPVACVQRWLIPYACHFLRFGQQCCSIRQLLHRSSFMANPVCSHTVHDRLQ